MFKELMDYPWVLEPYRYADVHELLSSLEIKVIARAAGKAKELEQSVSNRRGDKKAS
jgi:hypothetical protein